MPIGAPPGVAELRERLATFRYSVFRLETLQVYTGSSEDPARAAFRRGDPMPPPDPDQDRWVTMLRAHRDAGRTQQRVHVVREPISDYLAFELTWEYGPHVAAGEDIRIIPVTDTWPLDVPERDFWLVDSRYLFHLRYADTGAWLDALHVTDPAMVAQACFERDAALHQAMSWAEYLAAHPTLLHRVPKGA